MSQAKLRVAIVHYWLPRMRGGEKVVEALCDLYPQADVYAHMWDPDRLSEKLRTRGVHTTFIASLPGARRLYRYYLPLTPLALEQLDLRDYDLVISSESGPAKGVITGPNTLHVCYCHSPMRYAWDLYPEYLAQFSWPVRQLVRPLMHYMRLWDYASAQRVDAFVANSTHVRRRIQKFYRRDATVIHPPVDIPAFTEPNDKGYYLMVTALIDYKRVDVAIDAFNELRLPLVIVGDGTLEKSLRRRAGPTVELVGWQSADRLQAYYRECRAVVFPGEEDFGMVPVEAMAAGRPVIAYGVGGVLDTVVDGETGILYSDPGVAGLVDAVRKFEARRSEFEPTRIHARARRFAREEFLSRMRSFVDDLLTRRASAD